MFDTIYYHCDYIDGKRFHYTNIETHESFDRSYTKDDKIYLRTYTQRI